MYPFRRSTGSLGVFQATSDELSAAGANLNLLLSTNRGERPMSYDYGCSLRDFLFENNSPELKEEIFERIASQVDVWLPFIEIKDVLVSDVSEDNVLRITVKYSLRSAPEQVATVTRVLR